MVLLVSFEGTLLTEEPRSLGKAPLAHQEVLVQLGALLVPFLCTTKAPLVHQEVLVLLVAPLVLLLFTARAPLTGQEVLVQLRAP